MWRLQRRKNKMALWCNDLIVLALKDAGVNISNGGALQLPTLNPRSFRKIGKSELSSGDVVFFKIGHVGFWSGAPPVPGMNLLSVQGRNDLNQPWPGVTYGDPKWFGQVSSYQRVRIPCK